MKNTSLATKLISLLVFLAVAAYFGVQTWNYFVSPETTTLVYAYRAERTVAMNGFVVRDESVIDCSDSLVELTRTEGERVAAGKPLATVYQSAQTLTDAQELAALREQLAQLEYAKDAARDSEAALRLDSEIENSLIAVRSAFESGNYAALDSGASALKTAVLRREYAYHGAADLGGRIETLEAQIASAAGAVSGASRVIAAPFAGTYSAITDGYEDVLTPGALEDLTPAAFEALRPASVSSTVGKLIRGTAWYYAAVVDAREAEGITEGSSYQLVISGTDLVFPVTARSVSRAQDGKCLVVLRSVKYLSHVTMLRQQSAELILESFTGLRVPKNAVRIGEDGQTGVFCRIGLQSYFKPVRILYQGEDYCVVVPDQVDASTEGQVTLLTLRANDEVIVSARELYNGKVVDEP